MFICRK